MGALLTVLVQAPAAWLAAGVQSLSAHQIQLQEPRGTLWHGSARLVLTGGKDSQDQSSLPTRLNWTLQPGLGGSSISLHSACCTDTPILAQLHPGWNTMTVRFKDSVLQLPADMLAGLGTPWNTLQLGGSLRLSARELKFERVQGRWLQSGDLQLDLVNLSSRLSTLAPLGSYRLSLTADTANPGVSQLRLSTLEGALQLYGQGTLSASGKSRFVGEASAAPGREEALNNLLNIIGRRQGARSVLTIG